MARVLEALVPCVEEAIGIILVPPSSPARGFSDLPTPHLQIFQVAVTMEISSFCSITKCSMHFEFGELNTFYCFNLLPMTCEKISQQLRLSPNLSRQRH